MAQQLLPQLPARAVLLGWSLGGLVASSVPSRAAAQDRDRLCLWCASKANSSVTLPKSEKALPGFGRSQGFGPLSLAQMAQQLLPQLPARAVLLKIAIACACGVPVKRTHRLHSRKVKRRSLC
jgi:pimeloyl-ACP methyl ester carboxylesterase